MRLSLAACLALLASTAVAAAATTPTTPAKSAVAKTATADPSCVIKGNVNKKGQKIYHTAGSSGYARIKMNPAEGDTCFKTEAEATAAGFRAPGTAKAKPVAKSN